MSTKTGIAAALDVRVGLLLTVVGGLLVILGGCVAGEPADARSGAEWNIEAGADAHGAQENSSTQAFRPEDVASLDAKRRAFNGRDTPILLAISVDDGPEDVLQDDESEVLDKTYIEVAFPDSEHPDPRRFYLGTRLDWGQLRQRGYSGHWLNAWPNGHAEFYGFKRVWVYVTVPQEDFQDTGNLPRHPLGNDLLA